VLLTDERKPEIQELFRRLPQSVMEERQLRRYRASDLAQKKAGLPEEERPSLDELTTQTIVSETYKHVLLELEDFRTYRR
jgi:hypothetical protein